MKRKMATLLAGAAMMLGLANAANAIPTLYLQNGSNFVEVVDNQAGDTNADAGIITFSGTVGAFDVLNVSTGISLQGHNFPYIHFNSIDGSTAETSTTLLLKFSDISFTGSTFPFLAFTAGGVVGQGGAISYAAYYDTNNTLYGTSSLIGSGSSSQGAFDYTSPAIAMPSSSFFSLTEILSITHPSSTYVPIITSFDAEVAPVPEPGTMLLLGAGFLGLAIYGKRRKNA